MIEGLKERGARLAKSLRDKLGKDESIESLKEEVVDLSEFIMECLELLDQQGLSGFEHAVVVRAGNLTMKLPRRDLHGDFILDSTVVISKASPFAQNPGSPEGIGKIISFDPEGHKGWALVDFGKGHEMPLRYGHPEVDKGFSDIVLVGKPILRDTEKPIITVAMQGSTFDVVNIMKLECKPGDTVLIHPHNRYVVSTTEPLGKGFVTTIDEVLDSGAIVTIDGRRRQVTLLEGQKLEKGDRVLVDDSASVVIMSLPRPQSIAIASDIEPVKWDDVIGLEDAKKEAMRVINEVAHADVFNAYNADAAKGIILIGPPGNGKTHIGKAIATRLRELLGSDGDLVRGFMYIKATEILDMYVGEAPRKVREIFARAEEYFRRTGQKCIIFVDEVESVLAKRGNGRDSGSSDSITNAFLTELDGIQRNYAFVIGATNRPDLIDSAAMRAGRFDRKIYVGRPEDINVPKFFELQLRGVPLAKGVTLEQAIEYAASQYTSSDYGLIDMYFPVAGVDPTDEKLPREQRLRHVRFKLSHVGSGAMIKTIINNAKAKAIERDIAAGVKGADISGLTLEDIRQATSEIYREHRILKHDDEIQEFMKAQGSDPVEYEEVKEAA